ncbi:outer membrane protein [Kaistia terrae]|jgi:outer membrane immunogenic protein|uniref:Outer membrane protein n=1 Tax=Kaistia terrae TaxID=537017 RepID=A0ABW0PW20_9HYPH|nr:outer membrane protein [Kaistia terrae]MCX5577085.1 porin family protein [Kaistia terrae]
MKFILRSATMASVLVLGVVGAHAADLTYEPVPVAAPEVFNWTGFYIGVHGGVAAGDFKYPGDITVNDDGDIFSIANGELEQDASGGFGGVQVGYNWQFNQNWVVGIEADIAASSYEGKLTGNLNAGGTNVNFEAGSEVEWFGTVRGRLGYALDNLLLYGTGGLAYGSVESSISAGINGNSLINESESNTQYGWTVGAGFEYGVTKNITLKTEYLYVDLGSEKIIDANFGPFHAGLDAETKFHTLKAGLNYKF